MNCYKRITAFLVIIAFLFSFTNSVYATEQISDNTYVYIDGNIEIEIQYSKLSEEQLTRIVSLFTTTRESTNISSYGLTCTLFGHKITTSLTNVTTHNVYNSYPYCERNQYSVDLCERCDYSNTTLIQTSRVGCCS